MVSLQENKRLSKPKWLKIKLPIHENFFYVSSLVRAKKLHTICQSARCPNVSECWTQKTATFLILGETCTRNCAFCGVKKGFPSLPPDEEAERIAESIAAMTLDYAVITSVTRDDLPDGGASLFVQTIKAIKNHNPGIKIEVLIPDFAGDEKALEQVVNAEPDVLNHNIEVPEVLYPRMNRPLKNYRRSLRILSSAKKLGAVTKSGLMVGLGETEGDLVRTFRDLRESCCNLLTIGQYLQPTKDNYPVKKYYSPEEFVCLKDKAKDLGFEEVEAGPLVRSSYRAHELYRSVQPKREVS